MYSTLFIEYTTSNELQVGISIDGAAIGLFFAGIATGSLKGDYDDYVEARREPWHR
jgi:hypothetical protein